MFRCQLKQKETSLLLNFTVFHVTLAKTLPALDFAFQLDSPVAGLEDFSFQLPLPCLFERLQYDLLTFFAVQLTRVPLFALFQAIHNHF